MAGPAIRCWELSKQLSKVADVTLTTKFEVPPSPSEFKLATFNGDQGTLIEQAQAHDILLVQGNILRDYPALQTLGKYLVVDLYDPFIFETYHHLLELPPTQGRDLFLTFLGIMNEQMHLADFSICASDRQRDFWIGRYCALGRLSHLAFENDPAFRQLIGLVPFGISDEPVQHERPVLKGVVPGIERDDKVLLWGGGIWNWFDPLTVIRAVAKLSEKRNDIKLYFLGVKHPNPDIPEMEMSFRAVKLAEELGVKDKYVFFNHGWVPYNDRQNYLAEADIGISSHFDSIETRFSFRTRVLDYLWAGLPILTTEGDSMAELTATQQLGGVCRYNEVDDWVQNIERIVDDAEFRRAIRQNVNKAAENFRWSRVAQPLALYCQDPYKSVPAFVTEVQDRAIERPPEAVMPNAIRLAIKGYRILKNDGVPSLLGTGARFIAKRIKP